MNDDKERFEEIVRRVRGGDTGLREAVTDRQLADVINAAFTRWDPGHLYVFRFADGTMVGTPGEELAFKEAARTKIAKRNEGETFEYEFDLGDSWEHRCTVLEEEVEPENVYGVRPKGPVAVWGWGVSRL